jgi:hypothetical protein
MCGWDCEENHLRSKLFSRESKGFGIGFDGFGRCAAGNLKLHVISSISGKSFSIPALSFGSLRTFYSLLDLPLSLSRSSSKIASLEFEKL